MTEQYFAFRAYNSQTMYAYGTEADAETFADILNKQREINLHGAYPLTTEEAAELNLDHRDDVIILEFELACRTSDEEPT